MAVLAPALLGAGLAACGAKSEPPRWETVWSDDFDGDTLDRTKWRAEVSCWGGGNNERQCYTDRPENISVEGGVLKLRARPEVYTGPLYPSHHKDARQGEATRAYTSGKIMTRGLASWRYGRFSARIKLPAGQGAWPAFWMMPADDFYGPWPLSGEIDIMEAVNLETPCAECVGGVERRSSGALHFGGLAPENTYLHLKTDKTKVEGPANEWHVFTLEWGEGVIQWFVDGKIFMRLKSDDWHTASLKAKGRPFAPFDQPFYLILNLAVGGNLPEKSNQGGFDDAAFPAEMLVDWVRVEQCTDDIETGLACLSKQEWSGEPQGPWEKDQL
ncbi:glycoside hydrolase family 16 protein [Amphiplicatus metriothermophilus]|uniref:glycoside hydrolase family 16 protein n=1 Tax=Amphiplicatus metriothermophilus TaxID=1519374 RepID=UPI00181FEC94|nr:glycoside hydrolase family 16 protein [Amphiplicatus metriothermophilus]MBB5518475.1 beta-glucanase (GH16 family) [Amphiplicatus metriothermophilus]